MSAVEILAELPKLTDDVQFLHELAETMFLEMDQLEAQKCPQQTPVRS